MNNVNLIGRLVADPEVRYSQGDKPMAIARYRLAVDRRVKSSDGQQTADFITIAAFGKAGEFAEKYFKKGLKIAVRGRIQTGSYTNKDGQKVYTFEVIAEEQEFVESKNASGGNAGGDAAGSAPAAGGDGFMDIPETIDDADMPWAQ